MHADTRRLIEQLAQEQLDAERGSAGELLPDIQINIQINNRELRDMAEDAVQALELSNVPPQLFVFGRRLARVEADVGQGTIQQLDEAALCGHLTRAANFHRLSFSTKTEEETRTAVVPPSSVIKDILASPSWPPSFPPLLGVTSSPSLRPDGSVLDQPGYDASTQLYYRPPMDFVLPQIPDQPTEADARRAQEYLTQELFADFPFCDAPDLANMLATLLTPVVRPAIGGNVPLCLLDKPSPGSGATLLADIVAVLATGQPAAKSLAPRGQRHDADEEWRKKITSILMRGASVTVWDNVEDNLSSASLAMALTTPLWSDRLLGGNSMVTLPVRTTWIATGNNIHIAGDLARRSYHIRIDAKVEHPWERQDFRHPALLTWIRENRAALVAAVLTMARAWFVAGQPPAAAIRIMGGFEDWTRIVGGILGYGGVVGFLGNADELHDLVDDDGPQWAAFLAAWVAEFGESGRTLGGFVVTASLGLKEAIPESVEYDPDRERVSKIRLGMALKKRLGQIHGGHKLVRSAGRSREIVWSVQPAAK